MNVLGGDATGSVATHMALDSNGLSKTFAGRTVLFPFRLTIACGEIRALLGQNGSGKSTLIKILSGLYEPDRPTPCLIGGRQLEFGRPLSAHELGIRFVHQDLGLTLEASVLDNLSFTQGYPTTLGTIRRRQAERQARQLLDGVGLFIDPATLVADLSNAQRTGVAVARALGQGHGAAQVLVLDEPTATLPEAEVIHLHSMLRAAAASGVGILYVTHHLDEVFSLASTVSVLRDGHMVHSGRVLDTDRSALVHHLIGGELEDVRRENLHDHVDSTTAKAVLSVRDLWSDPIRGASLEARAGEVVGVYGLTGSGRETLLGAIFGARPRTQGEVSVGSAVVQPYKPQSARDAGAAYVPPDRKTSGAFLHLNADENLTLGDLKPLWKLGFLRFQAEARETTHWFNELQVSPREAVHAEFATFSGGNQQKIVLGKWLRTNPHVLLLDEPTQGVDVGAKAEIHRKIIESCEKGMAVLLSSTDIEELATLCDRVLFVVSGLIAGEITGDFTDVEINQKFHEVQSIHGLGAVQ